MGMKILLLLALLIFTACGKDHKKDHIIAKIPEASGICYNAKTDTLFAVSDRGRIYELSLQGKKLRHKDIGKYDLEGIACDTSGNMLLGIDEGADNLLLIDPKTLNIKKIVSVKRSFHKARILQKDKEYGLEGVTIDPSGTIYLSNQSHYLFPHTDPSVIVTVRDLQHPKTPILSLIDPRIRDIAGLSYKNGALYFVSDTDDRLYRYDLKKGKIDLSAKLPKFAQEGITFDNKGNIYFADDNGHIFRYKEKRFGIE